MPEPIRVLHVDDDAEYSAVVERYLEAEGDRFEVVTTTSANTALNRLGEWGIDCVVSDFQMPEMDGLAFLRRVRAERPGLPFLLLTGRGSEEVASRAISAGVTDYIQKGGGRDVFTLLGNRVENAVENARTERALEAAENRLRLLVEESTDAILVVGRDGTIQWANPVTDRMLGRPHEAIIGSVAFEHVHPADRDRLEEAFSDLLDTPGASVAVRFTLRDGAGESRTVEARGRNLIDHPAIEGVVVYLWERP